MRILHLTLKREWFDKISSGEKIEEYRAITKYWITRLCCTKNILDGFQDWDIIEFRNGYSKTSPSMQVECEGVDVKEGKPEWGANVGTEYFVIKLGKILSIKNYK